MFTSLFAVTAAANGLQAWKILENPSNHIDLVLTEVAIPGGFSGISLLSKIMSNDACKNIPVISEYFSYIFKLNSYEHIFLFQKLVLDALNFST